MASNTKWAVVVGAILVFLSLGGAFIWQNQNPHASAIASLTEVLPPLAGTPIPEMRPQEQPSAPSTSSAMTPDTAPKVVQPSSASPTLQTKTETPHFDVVRVEPKGDTVVAGKGEPNADVALLASGKVVAKAKADPSGQFVLLPPPLAPGDYDLTLRQTPDGRSAMASSQSVTVSVPKKSGGEVVVALAEPGKPTKLLSAPTDRVEPQDAACRTAGAPTSSAGNATAPATSRQLSIGAVDLENGSGFHASGSASPGTAVHVYLNNSRLADVTAGKDGAWAVTIRKGLAGGHYTVRADAAGSGQAVTARAEVPFDVPVSMATLPPASTVSPADAKVPPTGRIAKADDGNVSAGAASPANTPAPDPSSAVIDQVVTHQVSNGDNLWMISRHSFGDGRRFTQIYEANATQIRDPNLIYPGQIFVMPSK